MLSQVSQKSYKNLNSQDSIFKSARQSKPNTNSNNADISDDAILDPLKNLQSTTQKQLEISDINMTNKISQQQNSSAIPLNLILRSSQNEQQPNRKKNYNNNYNNNVSKKNQQSPKNKPNTMSLSRQASNRYKELQMLNQKRRNMSPRNRRQESGGVNTRTLNSMLSEDISSELSSHQYQQQISFQKSMSKRNYVKKRSSLKHVLTDLQQHILGGSKYDKNKKSKFKSSQTNNNMNGNGGKRQKFVQENSIKEALSQECSEEHQYSQYFKNNTINNEQEDEKSCFKDFKSYYETSDMGDDVFEQTEKQDSQQDSEEMDEEMDVYMQQWEEENKQFSHINDFDLIRHYKIYFPHNNFSEVYEEMNDNYKPSEISLDSFQKMGPSMVHKRLKFQQKKKTQIVQQQQKRRATVIRQSQCLTGQTVTNKTGKSQYNKSEFKRSQSIATSRKRKKTIKSSTVINDKNLSDSQHRIESHSPSRKKLSSRRSKKGFQIQLSPLKNDKKNSELLDSSSCKKKEKEKEKDKEKQKVKEKGNQLQELDLPDVNLCYSSACD